MPDKPRFDKTTIKNAKRMRLLALVTEFQKDVAAVRKEFGTIKEPGNTWLDRHMNIYNWFKENGHPLFTHMSNHPPFVPPDTDPYYQKIMAIGKKFKLPFNLYYHGQMGVSAFVLTDWIIVPNANWDFIYDVVNSGEKAKWIGIRTYAPLDEDEVDVMKAELYKAQGNVLPAEVMRSGKILGSTERNLTVLESLAEVGDGFTGIELDKPTAANVAEEFDITGVNARKIKERLKKLAIELFGYGIEV